MKSRRASLLIGLTLLLAVLSLAAWFLFADESPLNRASSIRTTLEWARLDPFPRSASHFHMQVLGNMFTRGFVADFDAPLPDINVWLTSSPGTRAVIPVQEGSTRRYAISPGGGALFAEVIVDDATGHVHVRTYWS